MGTFWPTNGSTDDVLIRLPEAFRNDIDGKPNFCVGCHGGIGATRDGIFSFHRKLDPAEAYQRGWFHWSQQGLRGIPERPRADGEPEYTFYLRANGAGDEFRGNEEVLDNFYGLDGQLKPESLARLRTDIATLLFASPRRAMALNKAYWRLVREQVFLAGRDAMVVPMPRVHPILQPDQKTGVVKPVSGY